MNYNTAEHTNLIGSLLKHLLNPGVKVANDSKCHFNVVSSAVASFWQHKQMIPNFMKISGDETELKAYCNAVILVSVVQLG